MADRGSDWKCQLTTALFTDTLRTGTETESEAWREGYLERGAERRGEEGGNENDRTGRERMVLLAGLANEKKAMLGNNKNEDDTELKECVYDCASVSRDCPSVIHCDRAHE